MDIDNPKPSDQSDCNEVVDALREELYWDINADPPRWNRGKVHDLQDLPRRLDAIFERFGLTPSDSGEISV